MDAVVAVGEIVVGSQSPWEMGSCLTWAAFVAVLQRRSFQTFCTGNKIGEFAFLYKLRVCIKFTVRVLFKTAA